MDPEHLKAVFHQIRDCRDALKVGIVKFDKKVRIGRAIIATREGKRWLKELRSGRGRLVDAQRECEEELVVLYRMAVKMDVDLDGSRLLSIHRFFYRNHMKLEKFLHRDVFPHFLTGLMSILLLTAVVFIYVVI
ncbi:unnamed protein product [Caenorhabditis brenneri]